MKKIFLLTIASLIMVLIGCAESKDTLKIGVNFYPMPEIVELIREDLLTEGIEIEAVQMDYNILNTPLHQGEIDGNLIQHQYFMNFFNQANDANLVVATPVYHSLFALYSGVYDTINDIPNGETIYIPEDVVNLPRALLLLESLGLIELAEGKTTNATLTDVQSNPKNLNFVTRSLGTTAQSYHTNDRKLAVMYPSYARTPDNQLMDASDVLAYEELNELTETYAISFVVRQDNLDDPRIVKFIEHLTSEKVRAWIEANYGWAAIPAF